MLAMNPSTIDLTQDQNPSTIDLTQDIQDDHELLPEPPSTVDLTQDVKDNEALPAEPLHLGTFNFNIVGTRYYKGECHSGEFVGLVREPSNPCDRNAIRIDNLRGEKVGHIKKDEALSLSKIMDQYRHIIMDGTIPGGGDQWTIPLQIDFYGTDPALAKTIVAILKPARTHLYNSKYAPAVAAAAAAATAFPFTAPAPILVQKYAMNWTVQQKDLDDMFDAQSKMQLEGLPLVPTPPTLVTELMEHQVTGLRWMVRNEVNPPLVPFFKEVKQHLGRTMWFSEITNSSQSEPPKPIRGGILADDMGLGKTIQAIALILSNPPAGHKYTSALEQETQKENAAPQTHTHMNIPPPTKTAVKQVKLPILQRLLMAAGISVTASKKDALVNLCMESLASGKLSVKAYYLGLTTKSLTTRTSSTTTTATNKTTLIICPVSVMSNWVEQIESHVQPGTLRVGIYHGPERESVLANLDTLDVLVASYNTVAHDYGKGDDGDDFEQAPSKKQKGMSIFHHIFHRILLDEAHMIRNSKTRVFKACFSLQAHLKWALTGTPLQNKAEDVHSLFEFLGVEPLGDPQVFRRAISQPLQQGDPVGLSRLRVMMAHVALRRNKQVANLNMPNKSVEFRAIDFPPDNAHKWIHDALFQTARCAFAATLSEGDAGALKNYSSIFESMLRIRQACCSGVLVPKARLERAEAVLQEIQGLDKPLTAAEGMVLLEKLNGTFQDESTECAVCLMDMDESECVILRSCSHVCCEPCLSKVGEVSGKCPFCRVKFSLTDMIRKSAASKAIERGDHGGSKLSGSKEELGPSPKIQALLAAIDEMNADEKGVIFSQFTGFLDEIEIFMKAEGHTFARIDGTKSALQRIDAMKRFSSNDNDGPRFMICSLHAAGTGINLTRGNHVFMMDTWWNKAVEMQAMDRVHRLSQTRSVRVVRFIMAGTIEERMVALQESKAAMGKGAMEKLKPEEARKLRIGEFRKLFELDVASSPVVEIDDR